MNSKGGKKLKAGDTVAYVICDDGSQLAATQRAFHVDEVRESTELKVDTQYYLAQQLHPVVSRLCDPLEATDAARIAQCLGLDPEQYRRAIRTESSNDNSASLKDEERFRQCEKFQVFFFSFYIRSIFSIGSKLTIFVFFLLFFDQFYTLFLHNFNYVDFFFISFSPIWYVFVHILILVDLTEFYFHFIFVNFCLLSIFQFFFFFFFFFSFFFFNLVYGLIVFDFVQVFFHISILPSFVHFVHIFNFPYFLLKCNFSSSRLNAIVVKKSSWIQ